MVHAMRVIKKDLIDAVTVTINVCKMPMVSNMVSMVYKRMGVPADIIKFHIVFMLGNCMEMLSAGSGHSMIMSESVRMVHAVSMPVHLNIMIMIPGF